MLLDFNRHREKLQAKQRYRDSLVEEILSFYIDDGQKEKDQFYLDHVRHQFPVHMLEGIIERLQSGETAV